MTDESDELFDDSEDVITTTEEVSPEAPKAKEPEKAAEPKRDQSGKFVAKEDPGEEEEEAAPPAAERQSDKSHNVPITALLDEREKRQRLEAQLAQYQRQLQEYQRQPAEPLDPVTDPEGYSRSISERFQQEMTSVKLAQSRFFAEREFGAEEVEAAFNYFNEHPQQSHALLSKPSPFHAAVDEYRRAKAMQEIGDDPVSYRTRLEEELRARIRDEILAEAQQEEPDRPRTPPRTLADAAGGVKAPPPKASHPLFD